MIFMFEHEIFCASADRIILIVLRKRNIFLDLRIYLLIKRINDFGLNETFAFTKSFQVKQLRMTKNHKLTTQNEIWSLICTRFCPLSLFIHWHFPQFFIYLVYLIARSCTGDIFVKSNGQSRQWHLTNDKTNKHEFMINYHSECDFNLRFCFLRFTIASHSR